MIVRQYAPCNLGRNTICLGKQGEINALRVEFDVSAWMAMYPDATVKLMHFAPDRPQDNPVIPTLGVEGTTRVWIVGEDDTASAGNGVIELLLIDERTGSTIKSATGYTTVLHSPSAGIEAQEAEAGYVRYDIDQSALLTDEQKAVARKNIGAGTGDGTGGGTGGITVEKDPTVPEWAKQPSKPTYAAGEVGADAAGTAAAQVGAHNVSGEAHADMRDLIEGLTSRLNALADSDDTTLDQLSEIVAYIKSNKTMIDAVTTGKVSTSDIVDNLTTNASGKVLSAAQGVRLKALIDAIVIPDKLPNPQPLTINGQSYDGSSAVEVSVKGEGGGANINDTTPSSTTTYSSQKIESIVSDLNQANETQNTEIAKKANDADLAKVAKSGSYNDLTNKPEIPTVPTTLPNPNKLKLTGAVTAEYDGSSEVSVEIPAGGGSAYELPIASPTTLGGVKPVAKTDEMTQAVGVDADGKLWALPGGPKEDWKTICEGNIGEDVASIVIDADADGTPLSDLDISEFVIMGQIFLTESSKVRCEYNGLWTSGNYFVSSSLGAWVSAFCVHVSRMSEYRWYLDAFIGSAVCLTPYVNNQKFKLFEMHVETTDVLFKADKTVINAYYR